MSFNNPSQSSAPMDGTSTTVSNTSGSVLSANPYRGYLLIQNTSDVNMGVNIFGGTAVIGGAGTLTLLPYGSVVWEGKFVPTLAISAISASGSNKSLFIAWA